MKEPPNPLELGGEPWQELFDQAGPAPALDPATKDKMRRDLTARFHARHGRGQQPRRRVAVSWAAAASVALCALWVWWTWRPAVARVEAIVSAGDVTVNGRSPAVGDEIRLGDRVRVQDLGRLTLGIDHISLRLAASEGPAELDLQAQDRVRLSSGKLYFDRAVPAVPVARKILAVHTPWGEVRDLGTQYQLDVTGDGFWIRVREGRISLNSPSGNAELAAGRALHLDANGTLTEIDDRGFGEAWSWMLEAAPPFALDGVTVAELLRWIGRETGWAINYASDSWRQKAEQETLRGAVPGLRADRAAQTLLPSTGWPHQIEDGRIVLGVSESPMDGQ